MNLDGMFRELFKVAAAQLGASEAEIAESLHRLQKLEEQKQAPDEMLRGAIAGSVIGGTGRILSGAVSGDLKTPALSALKAAPGLAAKAKQFVPLGRQVGAALIPGALIGTALPMARQHLNREAEKEKIRHALGRSQLSETRSSIKQTLGV